MALETCSLAHKLQKRGSGRLPVVAASRASDRHRADGGPTEDWLGQRDGHTEDLQTNFAEEREEFEPTTRDPQSLLNVYLRDAGVPLAPGMVENDHESSHLNGTANEILTWKFTPPAHCPTVASTKRGVLGPMGS